MDKPYQMHMRVLNPTRKKPKAGDIFVYSFKEGEYWWGRVIRDDAHIGTPGTTDGFVNVLLLYLYDKRTSTKEIPELKKEELLIPPQLNGRGPWLHGHFETVENKVVSLEDTLSVHCFLSGVHEPSKCFDEYGNELPGCIEPCAAYGVGNAGEIDWLVSKKLGLTS